MRVLDHDDRGVDHGANGNRDAAEAHDVRTEPEQLHGGEGHQDADRQHDDRHKRASHVQQEDDRDQRHDDAFLDQRRFEGLDRGFDQFRAIVDGHDLGARREVAGDLRELFLGIFDDGERIRAKPLQDDAARDFPFTIQLGDAASLVGNDLDTRDIADPQRDAALGLQDDVFDIGHAFQIAAATHHEFEFRQLDRAAADIHVAASHRVADLRNRDALGLQS